MEVFMKMMSLLLITLLAFNLNAAEKKINGCKKIEAACKSAGYVKGAHKKTGKGLYEDCLKPVVEGKAIEGVTVEAADIDSCKARHEKRVAKRKEVQEQAKDQVIEAKDHKENDK